jgi:hypothetical protein
MKFNMISAVVLKTLGLTKFNKNAEGNLDISAEHRKTLEGVFGKEFADKFGEALNKEKAEAEEGTPEATAETGLVLMEALRAHHSTVVADGLKDLQAELATANRDKVALQGLVNQMANSSELDPKPEFAGAAGKPGASKLFKVDRNSAIYAGVNEFLETGNSNNYSAATIEVTDLKTEFGKYLSQNGNGLQLLKKLFVDFTSAKFFTVVRAVTEWRAVKALITSVSMQFTSVWTPGGKAAFKPLTIVNRRHKINYPIIPAEVLDSYMFHLYDESLSPDQMPITLYIWNELIYPALLQDIEMRMIWKGKFIDHALTQAEGDVATPPEDSMDGLETILVDAKTTGDKGVHFYNKFPNFKWKTATAQEVLDYVNGFVDWLSPFYKTKKMPLFISDDNKRIYKRAYKLIWGSGNGQDGDFGQDRVDYSNQMLTAPDGMFSSEIIFSTPKENMIMLRHKNEVPNIINDVQKHGYEVRIFGEYWLAVGFAMGNAVFAAVPTGYNPKALIEASLGEFDTYQEDFIYANDAQSSEESSI